MKKILTVLLFVFLCGCQSHNSGDLIKTKYFNVEVPSSWNDMYVSEVYEVDNNVYSLIFYDKASHMTDYWGHVFTISVYYETDEYDYLPSYDYLSKITDGKDTYVIIAEYPTDVQFDASTQESYHHLASTYEPIIESIEFVNNFYELKE